MKKLDNLLGGTINSYGGVDVNYQPTGVSIRSGAIFDGYIDTGMRIGSDGGIRDHYNSSSGLELNSFNTIVKKY